jgi:AcrR family transcriptional regulator
MADRHSNGGREGGPFAFDPPLPAPLALSRLPPGRHGLPREFVLANQRNRLMAGALESLGGGYGYLASTVETICEAAGVSRNTFYVHFADKEACFLATYDVAVDWLREEIGGALAIAPDWPRQLRALVAKSLEMLAADTRMARLCTVEVFFAGVRAEVRHRSLVDSLSLPLGIGRGERALGADLPLHLEPTLIGGAFALVARQLGGGEGPGLGELAPELTEYLLTPYLGVARAREIAASD